MNALTQKPLAYAKQLKHLAMGILVGYAITAIVFLGYAMLITYTQMSEQSLPMVVAVTTVLSVLVAGFDAARGATHRGWMWGMAAGGVYIVLLALIMVVLLPDISIGGHTMLVTVLAIGGGGLGGMLGINLKR